MNKYIKNKYINMNIYKLLIIHINIYKNKFINKYIINKWSNKYISI
jgi:hypothetical protein